MDQAALIEQLQNKDPGAFQQMVAAWQDMVYNVALGIVQDADDADDITQEVFIQVYLSIDGFKGEAKFSTWLYRIAISKALDHEKKKKRKKRFAFVQVLMGNRSEETMHPPDFDHPGVQLEQKENAAALFRALKKLPDQQRIAFTLHKMEGQTYQEIAGIMNTSLFAVESLMGRAKGNLKKILANHYKHSIR